MTRIPTQAELLALFDYDAATGLIRRRKRARHCPAGNIAGYIGGNGYRRIRVFGVLHEAPKLIWTMMTGEWPVLIVDHIDTYGPKADWGDRWDNLRLATGSENAFNKRKQSNNTSGHTGVYWHKSHRHWEARIKRLGKSVSLGAFKNLNDAIRARRDAEAAHFGDFAPQRVAS